MTKESFDFFFRGRKIRVMRNRPREDEKFCETWGKKLREQEKMKMRGRGGESPKLRARV